MELDSANSTDFPPHLRSILEDLDKSDHEARRIVAGLSDQQVNWHPDKTVWSIAQCLDHLGRANTVYSVALLEALKDAPPADNRETGPIQPGWFGRYFIRTLEPPPRRKLRAPRKIVPAASMPGREVLERFLRATEDVRAVIRAGAGTDLNRIRFHNPFIGFLRFSVGTGLLVITAHNRRHLWQAERVLERDEFPKN